MSNCHTVLPSVVATALSVGIVTRNNDFPDGDEVISRIVALLVEFGGTKLELEEGELNGNGMVWVGRSESEE
jgi:hypothetical protein